MNLKKKTIQNCNKTGAKPQKKRKIIEWNNKVVQVKEVLQVKWFLSLLVK